ncbi:MAG: hypothetical protein ACQGVC_06380 [Myxococcota bacterium]
MAPAPTDRRRFLVGSAALLAGGSVTWALLKLQRPGSPLGDADVARRIGARHAARYPDAAAELWQEGPPQDEEAWLARVAALRRADFEADRLVEVEGWWLAETELRLCVLLHETT